MILSVGPSTWTIYAMITMIIFFGSFLASAAGETSEVMLDLISYFIDILEKIVKAAKS
jgi:hypothetical protein